MAHIYFSFDFGTDEEKAQLARHKLEMWKQAFRLDKKMLYKFERESDAEALSEDGAEKTEETEKPARKGKSSKAARSKSHGKKKEGAAGVFRSRENDRGTVAEKDSCRGALQPTVGESGEGSRRGVWAAGS